MARWGREPQRTTDDVSFAGVALPMPEGILDWAAPLDAIRLRPRLRRVEAPAESPGAIPNWRSAKRAPYHRIAPARKLAAPTTDRAREYEPWTYRPAPTPLIEGRPLRCDTPREVTHGAIVAEPGWLGERVPGLLPGPPS